MISLAFDLSNEQEAQAFFGAFFKFVEAAEVIDAGSMSLRSDTRQDREVKVVTFTNAAQAEEFQAYWTQRRRWLGL